MERYIRLRLSGIAIRLDPPVTCCHDAHPFTFLPWNWHAGKHQISGLENGLEVLILMQSVKHDTTTNDSIFNAWNKYRQGLNFSKVRTR